MPLVWHHCVGATHSNRHMESQNNRELIQNRQTSVKVVSKHGFEWRSLRTTVMELIFNALQNPSETTLAILALVFGLGLMIWRRVE